MSKLKIKGFNAHVNIPVEVDLLDDEACEFVMKFKRMDRPQLEKIVHDAQERAMQARDLEGKKIIAEGEERVKLIKQIAALNAENTDVLVSRIVSWNEFYDEDGTEVKYSEKLLRMLLEHPAYFKAIDGAFWRATGERLKN